uniref:Sideroflexin-3 n=1 Tax=Equus asinus TaxID=9793 RepID=A0A9L0IEW3_EQUAS
IALRYQHPGTSLGPKHFHGQSPALLHCYRSPKSAAFWGTAGSFPEHRAELQGWRGESRAHRGPAVEGQVCVRLCLPSGHRGEGGPDWPHVSPGAHEHDHHWLHAHLLQTPTVVFWQWVNQSFNAVVNYSNRSGDAPITVRQLGTAYVSATTGAVATALGLKSLTKHLPPLVSRFVPFAAVAAANCINIPLMRQRELQVGIPVTDEAGQRLGHSVAAAKQGIFQVVVSRICMAIPAMAIPPVIMDTLEKKDFLKRRPWLGAPLQVGLVGFCLVFATPLCCALFPQRSSINVSRLEPELRSQIREQNPRLEVVYYNKGL